MGAGGGAGDGFLAAEQVELPGKRALRRGSGCGWAGESGVVDALGELGLVGGGDEPGVVDPGWCRRGRGCLGSGLRGWERRPMRWGTAGPAGTPPSRAWTVVRSKKSNTSSTRRPARIGSTW